MSSMLFSKFRLLGKRLERVFAFVKWSIPRKKIGTEYTAHVLAVKNPNYVRIGKIAVASFLYHNPKSKVVIHCDQSTKEKASFEFRYFLKRSRVQIIDVESENDTWQVQKINLLVAIARVESNFYMDCDVRWNASLTLPDKCTSYVAEFSLMEKSPYRELLPHLSFTNSNVKMLNTTFVYLYPGQFTDLELGSIMGFHEEIVSICNSEIIARLDLPQILRLSEQLAVSFFLAKFGREFVTLKSTDGHMDGSFLESSYYGATGVEF